MVKENEECSLFRPFGSSNMGDDNETGRTICGNQDTANNPTLTTVEKNTCELEGELIAMPKTNLLTIPKEVKEMIWILAIKEENAIRPSQVRKESNKFWPYGPKVASQPNLQAQVVNVQPRMTVVSLSMTCKIIHDEIAKRCLFYEIHDIEFTTFEEMLRYLVAVNPVCKNKIRSIIFDWQAYHGAHNHAFNMLASCEELKCFQLKLNWNIWGDVFKYSRNYQIPNRMRKLRGLERLSITQSPYKGSHGMTFEGYEEMAATNDKLCRELGPIVSQPWVPVALKKIRAAQAASGLNIYGEGRLTQDVKPSIVSSRTRGQLLKQKTLDADGVHQKQTSFPKFSAFGDLLWEIEDIMDSRPLANERGKEPTIEVQVAWKAPGGQVVQPTWELLDQIINTGNVGLVAKFYVLNPWEYDVKHAIKTVRNFVDNEGPQKGWALCDLEVVLKRNDSDHK